MCSFTQHHLIFNTTKRLVMTITGGTLFVAGMQMDNMDLADLTAFQVITSIAPSIKTNIRIDGVLIDSVETDDGWVYRVDDGQTISIDWVLPSPDSGTPGRGYNRGPIAASDIIASTQYTITTKGNTDWTSIGSANNNVGTVFVATSPGSGTGTVTPV